MQHHLKQLASETLVYGLSGFVARFLSVLLVPIYTRIFVPADYGLISLVGSTMAIVSILVVLGLDASAHRWFWDTESRDDQKQTVASWVWCQFGISTAAASLIFVFAERIAVLVTGQVSAALFLRLAAAALPLSGLGSALTNWFRMQRRPWETVAFGLGVSVLTISLNIVFVVVLHLGIAGVYEAQLVSAVVSATAAVALLRDWIHPGHVAMSRLWEMLRYSMPLVPAGLALWVVGYSDRFFLKYYTDLSNVGLYQVGSAIAGLTALVTGSFQQAWGPFSISIHKQENAREVYASVLVAYVFVTSVFSTGLALFSPEAIRLVATSGYSGASSVVGIIAFSYVMIGLGYVAAVGPSVAKTTAPMGIGVAMAAVVNIGLNFALVPHLGRMGAAFSTLASQAIGPVYIFYRSHRIYPIPYRFGACCGIVTLAFVLIVTGSVWTPRTEIVGIVGKLALLSAFLPAAVAFKVVSIAQVRRIVSMTWR